MKSSVVGTLSVGEANRVCGELMRRQRGSIWPFYAALIVLMLVFFPAGYWLADSLGLPVLLGIMLAGIASYATFYAMLRQGVLARFRKKFADRGLPLELPLRVEASRDGLVYEVGGVKQLAQWPCVTEAFLSHGYWIFMAQGSFFFAPTRFFASKNDERAFIAAAAEFLSEDAKARSPDVLAFLQAQ